MYRDKLISFLLNRGWLIVKENAKFLELAPPDSLLIPNEYTISIPISTDKVDFKPFMTNVQLIIGEIYNLSKDELDLILEKEQTIFSVRVYDDETKDGKISLVRFDDLMDRVKNILLSAANFVVNPDITNTKTYDEATKYLNLCQFLQTEKGSFIAKIQLPTKEIIRPVDLFNTEPITSEQINEKVEEVLSFVSQSILNGNFNVTDNYVLENEGKLNLKLLKEIEILYDKVDIKNIDFSFSSIGESAIVQSQNVTREQITTLSDFIQEVSNKVYEVVEAEFTGKILSLKSKDPDGLKNRITLGGVFDNLPVTSSASLESEPYKLAIEAHKFKKSLIIRGMAKKSKSKLRFTEIYEVRLKE
jgi:hypothetical protein